MNLEELTERVDAECDSGAACGCHASPWDRMFYAAQILFPRAPEDTWRLMADFVMVEGE